MIVAARLESSLTKDEILELYLNCVFLGRGAWGVEVAAHSYFGKPAKALTITEGAMLAAVTKGPTYFGPDRAPARAQERLGYVLTRMREDGMLPADFKIEEFGPRAGIADHDRERDGRAAISDFISSIRWCARRNRPPASSA